MRARSTFGSLRLGTLVVLVVLLAAAPCPGVPARADFAVRVLPAPPPESLPSGLWFRAGHYEDYALETEPTAPTHAVLVGGVHTRARAAERAIRAVAGLPLSPGFPWVVASGDLGLVGEGARGLVVVAGLYASEAEAEQLRASSAELAVATLASEEAMADPGRRLSVTHVAGAPGEVDAYAPAVLDARAADLEHALGPADLRGAPVACRIAPGRVFSFDEPSDGSSTAYAYGYRWAPVRCGSRLAYVPVETTWRHVVTERRPSGETWIHQITDVMCDSPGFDVWRWTPEGRQVIEGEEPTYQAPCAG